MRIDFTQETDGGPVTFTGDMSPDEVTFLCEYALTDLIKKGLVPVSVTRDPDQVVKHAQGSLDLQ
jgi:hypothetical protein